jgi:hypothetical protein
VFFLIRVAPYGSVPLPQPGYGDHAKDSSLSS